MNILVKTMLYVAGLALLISSTSAVAASDDVYPVGQFSSKASNSKAFVQPFNGMDLDEKLNFQLGKAMFQRLWVTAPSSTQAADGLGPLYNARSCEACHRNNGRGQLPKEGEIPRSLVMRLSVPNVDGDMQKVTPEPVYGGQLQTFAIAGLQSEGSFESRYSSQTVNLADGTVVDLQVPHYRLTNLGYGALASNVRMSPRLSPALVGLGFLNKIPKEALLANEDVNDENVDGVSGKANRVLNRMTQQNDVGRFGWKAGIATLSEQIQDAAFHDIGLSVPLFTQGSGECTSAQQSCLDLLTGNSAQYDDLEAHQVIIGLMQTYLANTGVPRRKVSEQAEKGRAVFNELGCAHCHVPSFQIAVKDKEVTIWPYSDLLLHDMGEGLADNRAEGNANGQEWRTPPLWGIGLSEAVNGNSHYLHDGRARSLLEAILWHAGEAEQSRDAVIALDRLKREQLLDFLRSL